MDLGDVADDDALAGVRVTGDAVGRTVDGLALRGAVLAGCRLTGATLTDLDLQDVVLTDCDLSGATIAGAVLRRVTVDRCRLSGLVANDLSAADIRDVVIGTDQIMEVAVALFATRGIVIDDDAGDDRPGDDEAGDDDPRG